MNYRIERNGGTELVDLDSKEVERIRWASNVLRRSLFLEEKFDWIIENYLEFEAGLLTATSRKIICGPSDERWLHEDRHEANRRLSNLFTACRSYLDRVMPEVRDICSSSESSQQSLSQAISDAYDKHFEYRLMEALRNFVQHQGFAAYSISLDVLGRGEGADYLAGYYLDVSFGFEDLANASKFKASVRDELRSIEQRVELRRPAAKYVACLGHIHEVARAQVRDAVSEADDVFQSAIERFEENTIVEGVWLSDQNTKHRKYFEAKNSQTHFLDKGHVSSVNLSPGKD